VQYNLCDDPSQPGCDEGDGGGDGMTGPPRALAYNQPMPGANNLFVATGTNLYGYRHQLWHRGSFHTEFSVPGTMDWVKNDGSFPDLSSGVMPARDSRLWTSNVPLGMTFTSCEGSASVRSSSTHAGYIDYNGGELLPEVQGSGNETWATGCGNPPPKPDAPGASSVGPRQIESGPSREKWCWVINYTDGSSEITDVCWYVG
jgi:hypothetical protein